jgi:hypothetical protein
MIGFLLLTKANWFQYQLSSDLQSCYIDIHWRGVGNKESDRLHGICFSDGNKWFLCKLHKWTISGKSWFAHVIWGKLPVLLVFSIFDCPFGFFWRDHINWGLLLSSQMYFRPIGIYIFQYFLTHPTPNDMSKSRFPRNCSFM